MESIVLKNTNKWGNYQEGVDKVIYKRKISADMEWWEGTKANFKKLGFREAEVLIVYWDKVFESESGSEYWISPDKKKLVRRSDHWLFTVGSCEWLLNGEESWEDCYAIVEFKNMSDERFEDLKFCLSVENNEKKV